MFEQALKRKRCHDVIETCKSLKDLGIELDERTLLEVHESVALLKMDIATPLLQGSTTTTDDANGNC